MKQSKYIPGYKFGNNCVIVKDLGHNIAKRRIVECLCWCNNTFIVESHRIHRITNCGQHQFTGIENLSGSHINSIKQSAKIRKIEFCLSKQYLWNLFLQQNKKCALSGIDLILYPSVKDRTSGTASLDRKDRTKGYLENNVQWVHKDINCIKGKLNEKELFYWCNLVTNKCNLDVIKPKFGTSIHFKGYKGISAHYMFQIQKGSKKRNFLNKKN